MRSPLLVPVLALSLGCSTAASTADASTADAALSDAGAVSDAGPPAERRDERYCEVLAGTLAGSMVRLDVYNTIGLNTCPDAAWRALDTAAIQEQLGVTVVVLNGPRYWTLDSFEVGVLQNPTITTFGGIEMRIAGRIEVPLSTVMAGRMPYTTQSVRRDSTVRFVAARRVHELVDPTGRVFVMQSYSVQMTPQTIESLVTLGDRLTLPTGWSYRTRVLDQDLLVTAIDGIGTVTTDDFANTYQLTAQ